MRIPWKTITACLVLLFILLAIIVLVPSIAMMPYKAKEIQCNHCLESLHTVIESFRQDHDGTYPSSLSQLEADYDENLNAFFNSWPKVVYRIPKPNEKVSLLCWVSRPHCSWKDGPSDKRNVLYSDGTAKALKEGEFAEKMREYGITDPNTYVEKPS